MRQDSWPARPLRPARRLIVIPASVDGPDRCLCRDCAARRESRRDAAYRLDERGKRDDRLNPRLLGSEELRRRVDAALSRAGLPDLDVRAPAREGPLERMGFLRGLLRFAAAIRRQGRRAP
jgi:hypothetical protein